MCVPGRLFHVQKHRCSGSRVLTRRTHTCHPQGRRLWGTGMCPPDQTPRGRWPCEQGVCEGSLLCWVGLGFLVVQVADSPLCVPGV